MKEVELKIVSNEKVAHNIYKMILDGAKNIVIIPGQFMNIRVNESYLRRPISICDWDDKTVTIVYKVVGKGTELMSKMIEGEQLNVLIPLGNGFDIDMTETGGRPLLVGGGVGVPPMLGVAKVLVGKGIRPIVVMGFNEEHDIFLREEMENIGAEVHIATTDGSVGTRGFVTDVISNICADRPCTEVYACGPKEMLRAVDNTLSRDVPGLFSFEERMGCGFGVCMGCSCETKYGSKRICKEGPVLERSEIIW